MFLNLITILRRRKQLCKIKMRRCLVKLFFCFCTVLCILIYLVGIKLGPLRSSNCVNVVLVWGIKNENATFHQLIRLLISKDKSIIIFPVIGIYPKLPKLSNHHFANHDL